MLLSRTYSATEGQTSFTHADIAGVRLIAVEREDKRQCIISGTPLQRKVNYLSSGTLEFDPLIPFVGVFDPAGGVFDVINEKITIIWES